MHSNTPVRKFNVSFEQPVCGLMPFNYNNNPFDTEKNYTLSYANDDKQFKSLKGIGRFNRGKRPKTTNESHRTETLPSLTTKSSPIQAMSTMNFTSPILLKQGFQKCSGDDFKVSFDSIVEKRGDGVILLSDIEKVVKDTIGQDCPQWVVDKFLKLSEGIASYKRVCWDDFRGIIDRALRASELDCDGRPRSKPYWLTRPSTVDSSKLPKEHVTSAYAGDFRLRTAEDPASTSDLFIGTAKATSHPPGYGGHIPVDTRNPMKKDYCSATNARELSQDADPFRPVGYLPGYTGHVSSSGKGRLG